MTSFRWTEVPAKHGWEQAGASSDKLLLLGNLMKNADAYVMLPGNLSIESYGIVLPRGDWAFRLAVNTGLAEIYQPTQRHPMTQGRR